MGGIWIARGFLWQRAGLGYDANDLSLQLEGFRLGACGHGSCLVAVFLSSGYCNLWSRYVGGRTEGDVWVRGSLELEQE